MQKDFKELEATNSILKAKGKMCVRQCKELIEVLDENLQAVLGQVSTFVDTLMLIASVIKKHKAKNEALLQMIENDEIAEVPVTAMSRTQLVNPMVGGHTLKKASIALQRLNMANLNMTALNNGMAVDEEEAAVVTTTTAAAAAVQVGPGNQQANGDVIGRESPDIEQLEPVIVEDIQPSGSGRVGRARHNSRPSRTAVVNEEIAVMVNGDEELMEVQETVQENGTANEADSDNDVAILEDVPVTASRTLSRRNSSTQVCDSNFSADTSGILDVSIQSKFSHHNLHALMNHRLPSVALQRLDLNSSMRNTSQRLQVQTSSPSVASAFPSVTCNETVPVQTSPPVSTRGNRNSQIELPDIVIAPDTSQVHKKLSPRVNLVNILNSATPSKSSVPVQNNPQDDDDVVCCQETSRLTPRVNLVDIVKTSQRNSAEASSDVACGSEGRKRNPRVHLVDIAKPSAIESNSGDIHCQTVVEPRANLRLSNVGANNEGLADVSKTATAPNKKVNGNVELVTGSRELKILLPKVNVARMSGEASPSSGRINGTNLILQSSSCEDSNNNNAGVAHFQDNLATITPLSASLEKSQRNPNLGAKDVSSSSTGRKLNPRVNLVDIRAASRKRGKKPGRRKDLLTSEKVQKTSRTKSGDRKLVLALKNAVRQSSKSGSHGDENPKQMTPPTVPISQTPPSPVLARQGSRGSSKDDSQGLDQCFVYSPAKVPTGGRRKVHSRPASVNGDTCSSIDSIVPDILTQQLRTVMDLGQCVPLVNGFSEETTFPPIVERVQGPSQQVTSCPSPRIEEDPLEGPSWLYDTEDSRSGFYTRPFKSPDPTFQLGSSDEDENSFESPPSSPLRKKRKRKLPVNSKKSAKTPTVTKPRQSKQARGRRSLRIKRHENTRKTVKALKL